MIDIGVARPSAHGQAMMSTATALTSAWARRGSGPTTAQTTNVTTAMAMTAGTNQPADDVGEPLDRRAAALRLATMRDDLREQRVGADALGAHHERAGAVDGGADDAIAGCLLDRESARR